MELFEMFYHILRFLKLRSSCSFCFQMLGFLMGQAKHCGCFDILQIFGPLFREAVQGDGEKEDHWGSSSFVVLGISPLAPNLHASLSKIKTMCLTGITYLRKHFGDRLLSLKHAYPLRLSWLPQAPSSEDFQPFTEPSLKGVLANPTFFL